MAIVDQQRRQDQFPILLTSFIVTSFLLLGTATDLAANPSVVPATVPDVRHDFMGGFMSFYFKDTSNFTDSHTFLAHVTVLTGWVLGHGPCGPGCDATRVGASTLQSRQAAMSIAGNADLFGDWGTETAPPIHRLDISDYVRNNIQEVVTAISGTLQWEQEISEFDLEINNTFKTTKIRLQSGRSLQVWKSFDLNGDVTSVRHNASTANTVKGFNLQTKVTPYIRNDTGRPNSSPLVLFKPLYKIQLNQATAIKLTSSDKEDDLVQCRQAKFIEFDNIMPVPEVNITKDCTIIVPAMETYGFYNDAVGVIGVVVEDFNKNHISTEGRDVPALSQSRPLSSSVLDFMIWVVANMTAPEFLYPTPESQQVFIVYAGSLLSFPLVAKPHNLSLPTTIVEKFLIRSLPYQNIPTLTATPDLNRQWERAATSSFVWRSSESKTGDFILMIVAIDSEGFESMDRSYKIHVEELQQVQGSRNGDKPYFPFYPMPGTISCPPSATCSLPVYAKSGVDGLQIASIEIVRDHTVNVINNQISYLASYKGVRDVYRADVQFTAADVGNKSICFIAFDSQGSATPQCITVLISFPNPCETMQCNESSTCVPTPDGLNFTCLCPPDHTGRFCNVYIDPCNGVTSCSPGGICRKRNATDYYCQCQRGYRIDAGLKSCNEINECASNPCQNGGSCVDLVNDFYCNCSHLFKGKTCAEEKNDCTSSPCRNGGTCVDHLNSFQCICPRFYAGDLCETNLDPCLAASNPCLPGGRCLSRWSGTEYLYICQCNPGYSQTPDHRACLVDPFCDPNPCHSNGICVNFGDTFYCECIGNYTGERCEHAVEIAASWRQDGLLDNEWLNVCTGSNITFNWRVSTAPGNGLVSAHWYYEGRSHEMMALLDNGMFVELPAFAGRLLHLGEAALLLKALTMMDSGKYSVEVVEGNLTAGRIGTLHSAVNLRVLGASECHGCSSNPCQNGGSCVDMASGFHCLCPPGFTGFTCATVSAK